MCKVVRQRRVTELPYLTKEQVDYLHKEWDKTSGVGFLRTRLEETRQQLNNLQLDYLEIEAQNQQLLQQTGQQAGRITELEIELAAAQDQLSEAEATIATLQNNQLPNQWEELTSDQTVYGNCIAFMAFTPSTSTFNVASIYSSALGGGGTVDYPGQYCPYICIFLSRDNPGEYQILTGSASGQPTYTAINGSRLELNYSTNNQNILLLNRQ